MVFFKNHKNKNHIFIFSNTISINLLFTLYLQEFYNNIKMSKLFFIKLKSDMVLQAWTMVPYINYSFVKSLGLFGVWTCALFFSFQTTLPDNVTQTRPNKCKRSTE